MKVLTMFFTAVSLVYCAAAINIACVTAPLPTERQQTLEGLTEQNESLEQRIQNIETTYINNPEGGIPLAVLVEYKDLLDQQKVVLEKERKELKEAEHEVAVPIGPIPGLPEPWQSASQIAGALAAIVAGKTVLSKRYREHAINALKNLARLKLAEALEDGARAGGMKHTTEDPEDLLNNAVQVAKDSGMVVTAQISKGTPLM